MKFETLFRYAVGKFGKCSFGPLARYYHDNKNPRNNVSTFYPPAANDARLSI